MATYLGGGRDRNNLRVDSLGLVKIEFDWREGGQVQRGRGRSTRGAGVVHGDDGEDDDGQFVDGCMYCKEPEARGKEKSVKSRAKGAIFVSTFNSQHPMAWLVSAQPTTKMQLVAGCRYVCGGSILPYALETNGRIYIHSQQNLDSGIRQMCAAD